MVNKNSEHGCDEQSKATREDFQRSEGSLSTDFSLDGHIVRDFATACGSDSKVVTRERNTTQPRRRSRASIKGIIIDAPLLKDIVETEENSSSTLGTDFTLDDHIVRDFATACGRDSKVVTRERNTAQPRRRSRASIKGITIDAPLLKDIVETEENSSSTLGTDFTLDSHIVRDLAMACGRDSKVVTVERNTAPRRRSRASIKGAAIDDACLKEIAEREENHELSASSLGTDFSLDDRILLEFGNAFGRDSTIIARERNPAPRRRSRASIKGIVIDDVLPEEDEEDSLESSKKSVGSSKRSGYSSSTADLSISDSIAHGFETVFGRDSKIVTRERNACKSGNKISCHTSKLIEEHDM